MAPVIIPTLVRQACSLLDHTISSTSQAFLLARDTAVADAGPLAGRGPLLGRDASAVDPSTGVIDPHDINNPAIFAVFGLIGVAFVVTGIWFFFWAKNGGFHFRNDDWDDYKSTVLRRRGPNGTILTGATPSTQLGGGSVYKDVADDDADDETEDARTAITGTTGLSGITAGVSDIAGRERRRKKREAKERERERRREDKDAEKRARKSGKSRRKVGADGVLMDEEAEAEAQEHLRSYRHEKAARVGGINKEAEGSTWDGSTNPSHSHAGSGSGVTGSEVTGSTITGSTVTGTESEVTADLMSHREATPTSTPTRAAGGIRKVYSTADRRADREDERIRAEARRLQEKGRAAGSSSGPAPRRNFSYQRHDSYQRGSGKTGSAGSLRQIEETAACEDGGTSQVPGGWAESDIADGVSELGTKSYHHVIPGLSSSSSASAAAAGSSTVVSTDFAYQEEKRKRRGGAGHRRNRD